MVACQARSNGEERMYRLHRRRGPPTPRRPATKAWLRLSWSHTLPGLAWAGIGARPGWRPYRRADLGVAMGPVR
jgi:hypothetical protein